MRYSRKIQAKAKELGITELQLIADVLRQTNGNELQAANLLGVYPNSIRFFRENHPELIVEKTVTVVVRIAEPTI